MPELRPFRATRYAAPAGDASDLLAPPYDVISAEEARRLRARSPYNAVRLVLPAGDDDRYERAAAALADWLRGGVLQRDDREALWVYGQTFRHGGRELTRHGLLGALRLSDFSEGEVLPHEETHREPREDRLALLRATRTQLSPVFLVAPDPAGRLPELTDRATRGRPVTEARTPDGVRHRLWPVPAGTLADEMAGAATDAPLLIADGHHRYETALAYCRERSDHGPSRWTLACVVGASDPGLLCLPTHRALRRPPEGARSWRSFLGEAFEVGEEVPDDPEGAASSVRDLASAIACLPSGEDPLLLRVEAGTTELERVPTVAFDRRVLRAGFGVGPDRAVERGLLSYHREPAEARERAGEAGAAFLLPPLAVERTWELARAGVRLPPKSTYFWPKLPSGLLFRTLSAPS